MKENDSGSMATLRQIELNDLESVSEIEIGCYGDGSLSSLAIRQYYDLFSSTFIVATQKEKIVGFAVAAVCQNKSSHAWILDIALTSEWHRKGIGYCMCKEIENRLRKRGVSIVWATVDPSNISSLKLCEKFGFEIVELNESYFGKNNGSRYILKKQLEVSD